MLIFGLILLIAPLMRMAGVIAIGAAITYWLVRSLYAQPISGVNAIPASLRR